MALSDDTVALVAAQLTAAWAARAGDKANLRKAPETEVLDQYRTFSALVRGGGEQSEGYRYEGL